MNGRPRGLVAFRRSALLAGALAAAALLHGPPAHACTNATKEFLDESVRNLKIADAALEVDDFDKARRWLEPVRIYLLDAKSLTDPKDGKVHIQDGTIAPSPDAGLIRRFARLRALVRSRDPKSTNAVREEAMRIFESDVLGSTPDPTVLADYAEILSRVPARAGQATMLLRALREKDLIGSAHAYAALAELEKQVGDRAAETAARERCRPMTKKPAICG